MAHWLPTRKTIRTVLTGVHENTHGSAAITLDRVNGRVCFKLAWAGIGSPVAAHIHRGKDGPAVVPLFIDSAKRQGCVKARKTLIQAISESPSTFHVKVHTHAEPDGALVAHL